MSKKILIIDDDEQDRKGMAITLKKGGFDDIEFCETGSEGIEKASVIKPDIVVIDVVLPDYDGFDVCVKIKEIKDSPIKVLMITGHLDAVNAKMARTSGADEIIEKTPAFRDIVKTIEEVLTLKSRYKMEG